MRFIRSLILFVLLGSLLLAGLTYWWANNPLVLRNTPVEFRILPGSGLRTIAGQVAEAGIDVEPRLLIALGKLMRAETSIKAGSYAVASGCLLYTSRCV